MTEYGIPGSAARIRGSLRFSGERLIYEALRAEGAFVPQTPEEVAKAEEDFDDESVRLPASLRDPLAILKGKHAAIPG